MSHAAKQQKNKAVPLPTAGQSAKEEAKTLVAAEAARVVAILSLIDWTGVRQSLRDSGFEEEWIVRGIEEFSRFLALKVIEQDFDASKLSPSAEVDKIWHALLLFPKKYFQICRAVLPAALGDQVIDHDPLGAKNPVDHKTRYNRTILKYREIFNQKPPSDVWDEPEEREEPRRKWAMLADSEDDEEATTPRRTRISAVSANELDEKAGGEGETSYLKFYVQTLTGKNIPLQLPVRSTAADAKRAIQDKEGIPPDRQILIFRGEHFEDHQLLLERGVTQESVVHLVLKLRNC